MELKPCEKPNLNQMKSRLDAKKRELGLLEADLNVIINGLAKAGADVTAASSDICNKVNNTVAINADARVAPIFAEWSALSLQVKELKDLVSVVQSVSTNTIRATEWMVRNGGQALGIVDIDEASFEGCLSAVNGGKIALYV